MTDQQENIVAGVYDSYTETQKEILAIETRKTKNKLLTTALVIFLFDLLGLLVAGSFTLPALIIILVIPAVIAGLGFLAMKNPLGAMIMASLIILAVWVYSILLIGGIAVISGWIAKAIIVYLIIAGFQSSVEAMRINKELNIMK